MKFYIQSIGYNVLGQELQQELCQYQNKKDWMQPWFQRAWETCEFGNEIEALECLRTMYPDRVLTVLEDTGKVLSTRGHETGLTSMVIREMK